MTAVEGNEIQTIADQTTGEFWPAWSPDGTRLAYDGPASTQDQFQIVVVDPDGSNPTTLQHPPVGCPCLFTWSPDGTRVTAYQDGPTYDTGSLLIIDTSETVPPQAIPFEGGTSSSGVSWQRLAP